MRPIEYSFIPNPIILSVIPWFHAFGCLSLIGAMLHRSQIVFLPKFEEQPFLARIQVSLCAVFFQCCS